MRRRRRWRRWWPPWLIVWSMGGTAPVATVPMPTSEALSAPKSALELLCLQEAAVAVAVAAVARHCGVARAWLGARLAGLGCASAALSFQRNRFSRALHACDDHHEGLPLGQREANAAAAEQPLRCLSIARWHDVTLEQRFSAAAKPSSNTAHFLMEAFLSCIAPKLFEL